MDSVSTAPIGLLNTLKYDQVYFCLFYWLSRESEFDYLIPGTCEKNMAMAELIMH